MDTGGDHDEPWACKQRCRYGPDSALPRLPAAADVVEYQCADDGDVILDQTWKPTGNKVTSCTPTPVRRGGSRRRRRRRKNATENAGVVVGDQHE